MLLDEPTQGMGHEDVSHVTRLIKKVSANRTVLMVEHNMSVVASIADTISVLQRGRVIAAGPYAEVSKNPLVIEAYMGTTSRRTCGGRTDAPRDAESRRTSRRGTANRTSCMASISPCTKARSSRCWGAMARDAPPPCAPSWDWWARAQARCRSTGSRRSGLAPHRIARMGVGYCPEERGIFAALSTEENLLLPPRLKGAEGMQLEEIYDIFPNLLERADSPGTRLSGGEQQMLAVARILRTGARLLLLDEISEGLGAGDRAETRRGHPHVAAQRALRWCWSNRTSGLRRRWRIAST